MLRQHPRRTLRERAGGTGPRLASATHIPARAGLGEIKGKNPGVAVNAAGAFTKEKRAGFRVTVL